MLFWFIYKKKQHRLQLRGRITKYCMACEDHHHPPFFFVLLCEGVDKAVVDGRVHPQDSGITAWHSQRGNPEPRRPVPGSTLAMSLRMDNLTLRCVHRDPLLSSY